MRQTLRSRYIRPLVFSIFLAFLLESLNLALFGFSAGHSGFMVDKVLWTLAVGGIAMGSVLGVLIDVILVGQLQGKEAVWGTSLFSALTLGVAGKLVSLNMSTINAVFGLSNEAVLYFSVGVLTSAIGGAVLGWLLFTDSGLKKIEKWGF